MWIGASRKSLFISGALLVIVLVFISSVTLLYARGTFIWNWDGLEQQYPFFLAEGRWLRAVGARIAEGSFEVPLWAPYGIYGVDTMSVLINTLGNPINLISVFATTDNAELLLQFTIPVTLLLASMSFLAYCEYHSFDRLSSLAGMVAYVFGGFTAIMHIQIFMVYPLVLAPIILLGTDLVFDERSPAVLMGGTALFSLYSLTGTYMVCILLFCYCILRYVFTVAHKGPRLFALLFTRIAVPLILGIAIGGVLLVPMAANVMSQGRLGVARSDSAFYSTGYLMNLVLGSLSWTQVGADCYWGAGFLTLVCLYVTGHVKEAGHRITRWLFALFILILLVPIAGRVMNGLSYPNNRWTWAYSLLAGIVVSRDLPALVRAEALERARARRMLWLVMITLIVVALAAGLSVPTGFFSAGLLMLLVLSIVASAPGARIARFKAIFGALIASVLIIFNIVSASPVNEGASRSVPAGTARLALETNQGLDLVAADADAASSQMDSYGSPRVLRNAGIATGLRDATLYNSFYNSRVDEFHTSLGLTSAYVNYSFSGLDARSPLEFFAGTSYFTTPFGQGRARPWQFSREVSSRAGEDGGARLFAADVTAPTAWIGGPVMDRSAYDALSIPGRQAALLTNTVLEEAPASAYIGEAGNGSGIDQLPFDVSFTSEGGQGVPEVQDQSGDAVRLRDGKIIVTKPDSWLFLKTAVPAGREVSVVFSGLRYEGPLEPNSNDMTLRQKIDTKLRTYEPYQGFQLEVHGGPLSGTVRGYTAMSPLFSGKADWLVNTGYSDEGRGVIGIRFLTAGTYSISQIAVYADDLSALREAARSMPERAATDQRWDMNEFSCSATAAEDGSYLMLRIPYEPGWEATVDGVPAAIERADIAFMALRLSRGTHAVRLRYRCRPLEVGLVVSTVALAASVAYLGGRRLLRARRPRL